MFDTPPQRTNGRALTHLELLYFNILQHPRSRIEHINTVIKDHAMFKNRNVFRGHVDQLQLFVKISIHAAALVIRDKRAQGFFRYPGFGWWSHGEP